MTSILGSGDPAFYHSDRDQAEAERELQIRYEDSFMPNGERICVGCEQPFDPATMYDEVEGGLTFKICGMCGGAGAQSYRLNFEPSAYGVDPYKEFGIAKDFEIVIRNNLAGFFPEAVPPGKVSQIEPEPGLLCSRLQCPDRFIDHGRRDSLLRDAGLAPEEIAARVLAELAQTGRGVASSV